MALAWMASHYWPGDGVENNPSVPSLGTNQHPYMFDGTMLGMGLGFISAMHLPVPRTRYWWERYVKRARGVWIKGRRRWWGRLVALVHAIRLIFSSDWGKASAAVRAVAQDPDSRDLKHWRENARAVARDRHVGENFWRALSAYDRVTKAAPNLSRPDAELLTELAYRAFKTKGR